MRRTLLASVGFAPSTPSGALKAGPWIPGCEARQFRSLHFASVPISSFQMLAGMLQGIDKQINEKSGELKKNCNNIKGTVASLYI